MTKYKFGKAPWRCKAELNAITHEDGTKRTQMQGLFVPGSPMDKPEMMAVMAQTSASAGAPAVHVEGIENLNTVCPHICTHHQDN